MNKELAAAIKEENEAMIAFADILKRNDAIELEKKAARNRLLLARSAKAALYDDLMTL